MDIRPFVTNCKNYFITLEYNNHHNPKDVAFCQEIKSYYVDITRLQSQSFTTDEFKSICQNLVNLSMKLEKDYLYKELSTSMNEEIGKLISMYEKKKKS